ncbi:MAG: hypothetical protein ACWGQW_20995 [bacterium]
MSGTKTNGLHGRRRTMGSTVSHWEFISRHWHVITGILLATWWALVRIKRTILGRYVTTEQMYICKAEIIRKVEEADLRNTEQHDNILKIIITHLEKK